MEEQHRNAIKKDRIKRYSGPMAEPTWKPRFLDFHRLTVVRRYEYPMHRHDTFELIVIEKGPYHCSLNNVELHVKDGQLLVIQPGDRHQDHFYPGQSHYVLHFSLEKSGSSASEAPPRKIFASNTAIENRIITPKEKLLFSFFSWMEAEDQRNKTGNIAEMAFQRLQDTRLEESFWLVLQEIPEQLISRTIRNHSSQSKFISRLLEVFESCCHENTAMEIMAERMGMSRRSLSNHCRNYLGNSPGDLFLRYRLEQAALHLSDQELSIYQISDLQGFSSQFQFSRAFKRVYGRSPREFRKNKFEI